MATTSKQLLARGVGRAFDIVMKRGEGSWLWTHDGRKLLDFTSGVCVTNLGHSHPRVVHAAQQQVATLAHGMVRSLCGVRGRLLPTADEVRATR